MREYPEKWIDAFLRSTTVRETCEAANISKTKYYKLRNDSSFQSVLRERRDMCIASAVEALREAFLRNVIILQEIAENPSVSAQTRVNSISVMLSQLREWTTTSDILERLSALEAKKDEYVTVIGG